MLIFAPNEHTVAKPHSIVHFIGKVCFNYFAMFEHVLLLLFERVKFACLILLGCSLIIKFSMFWLIMHIDYLKIIVLINTRWNDVVEM